MRGKVNNELGIDALKALMEFSNNKRVKAAIHDCSQMKGTFTMANDYIANVYVPHMIKNGMICLATVVP